MKRLILPIIFFMSACIVWGHQNARVHYIQVDEDRKNSTTWRHEHGDSTTKYAPTTANMVVDKDSEHSFRGLKFFSADVSSHSHDVIENLDAVVIQPIEGNHEPHHDHEQKGAHDHARIEHVHGGLPLHWHANYNHIHLQGIAPNPRAAPEHNHHESHTVSIDDAHNRGHFGDKGFANLTHGHDGLSGVHEHDGYPSHGHGSFRHAHGETPRRVAEDNTPPQTPQILQIIVDGVVEAAPDTKTDNVVPDSSTNDNVLGNVGRGTYGGVPSVNTGGVVEKRKVESIPVGTDIEPDVVEKPISLLLPPPKRKRTQCYLPRGRPVEIEDIEYEYPVYIHSIKYDEEFSAILIKFRNHDIEPVILNRYRVALYNKDGEKIHSTSIGKSRMRYRGRLYIGKRGRKKEYRDSTFAVIQRNHLKEVFPKVKEKHGRIGSAFVMFHSYLFNGHWTDKEWTVKISCGDDVVFQYPPEAIEENETDDAVGNAPINPYLKTATMWAELKRR